LVNVTSVRTKIRREKWAMPLAFRLCRSIDVIGTDRDRSGTNDFLLVTRSNHGAIAYRFRDKRRLQYWQEASLMLTKPRYACRDQSRSPNVAPFNVLCMVSY